MKPTYCLLLYDKQFYGFLLFATGGLLGMFYKIQWYSILIINVMMAHMDVLKSIFKAIMANLKMLYLLSFLGTSFIAIFSIFSMSNYIKSLYED